MLLSFSVLTRPGVVFEPRYFLLTRLSRYFLLTRLLSGLHLNAQGFLGQGVPELSSALLKLLAHLAFIYLGQPAISLFFRQKLPLLGFAENTEIFLKSNK